MEKETGLFMGTQLTWGGFGLRLLFAILLVSITYNPEGYSYYHWIFHHDPMISAPKVFAGVVLIIGWTIYLRATFRSLGPLGLALVIALFASLIWLLVDMGWVPIDSVRAVSYIVMFVMSMALAIGISWSHLRRRISGQVDTDDVED